MVAVPREDGLTCGEYEERIFDVAQEAFEVRRGRVWDGWGGGVDGRVIG